jgi:hypothetical protein
MSGLFLSLGYQLQRTDSEKPIHIQGWY